MCLIKIETIFYYFLFDKIINNDIAIKNKILLK